MANPYSALHSTRENLSLPPSDLSKMVEGSAATGQTYEPSSAVESTTVVTEIAEVPITQLHPVPNVSNFLKDPGMARATQAADIYHPWGTPNHPSNRTVLQQHVDYFDRNKDGIITTFETYESFRALGFNIFMSLLAIAIIHPPFSLMSSDLPWFIPFDPLLRIWTSKIHRSKHGSDSGVYDIEGRYIPQKFEEIFSKWDVEGKNGLNFWDIYEMTQNLFLTHDFFGWFAAKFEWGILYLLCADENGLVSREKIRGVFDGSLFYQIENDLIQEKMKKRL